MKDIIEIILAFIPVIISVLSYFYKRSREKAKQERIAYEVCINFRKQVIIPYKRYDILGDGLTIVLDAVNDFSQRILSLEKRYRDIAYNLQGARFVRIFDYFAVIILDKQIEYPYIITLYKEWNSKNNEKKEDFKVL